MPTLLGLFRGFGRTTTYQQLPILFPPNKSTLQNDEDVATSGIGSIAESLIVTSGRISPCQHHPTSKWSSRKNPSPFQPD